MTLYNTMSDYKKKVCKNGKVIICKDKTSTGWNNL